MYQCISLLFNFLRALVLEIDSHKFVLAGELAGLPISYSFGIIEIIVCFLVISFAICGFWRGVRG